MQIRQVSQVVENDWSHKTLASLQAKDPHIWKFYEIKSRSDERPDRNDMLSTRDTSKSLWNKWEEIEIHDEVMYRWRRDPGRGKSQVQLIPPISRRREIIRLAHTVMNKGHMGINMTKAKVRKRAHWPGWSKETSKFCQNLYLLCPVQKEFRTQTRTLAAHSRRITLKKLSFDITGPQRKSSKRHVYTLTSIDQFTK